MESLNNADNVFYGSFFNSINELHSVLEKVDESSLVADRRLEILLQEMRSKLKFINEKLSSFNS